MTIWETIINFFKDIAVFLDSTLGLPFFKFIKSISGVVSIILLIAVIYLYIKTKYIPLKIKKLRWFLDGVKYEDKQFITSWREIIKMLGSNKEDSLKETLEKADELADNVLADLGFVGFGIEEKLENIEPDKLPKGSSQLILASKRVKNLSEKPLSKQESIKTLFVYELFLKDNGIL